MEVVHFMYLAFTYLSIHEYLYTCTGDFTGWDDVILV